MEPMAISELVPGSTFIIPWRSRHNVGRLIEVGPNSVGVRVREINSGSWEDTRWSRTARVVPVSTEYFYAQQQVETSRVKSTVDSPVERVHAICAANPKKKVSEIVALCVAEGINKNTAKTQYYAYQKLK